MIRHLNLLWLMPAVFFLCWNVDHYFSDYETGEALIRSWENMVGLVYGWQAAHFFGNMR